MGDDKIFKLFLFLLLCLLLVPAYYVFYTYVAHFGFFGIEGKNLSEYGAFGDFIGGTLNPAFTFITSLGLLISLYLQRTELLKSMKSINDTKLDNDKEIIRKQLQDDANMYIQMAEKMLEYKMFEITTTLPGKHFFSPNDLFRNPLYADDPKFKEYIKSIPDQMKAGSATAILLAKLQLDVVFAVECVCELLPKLKAPILKKPWIYQAEALLSICVGLGILTREVADLNFALILDAQN